MNNGESLGSVGTTPDYWRTTRSYGQQTTVNWNPWWTTRSYTEPSTTTRDPWNTVAPPGECGNVYYYSGTVSIQNGEIFGLGPTHGPGLDRMGANHNPRKNGASSHLSFPDQQSQLPEQLSASHTKLYLLSQRDVHCVKKFTHSNFNCFFQNLPRF